MKIVVTKFGSLKVRRAVAFTAILLYNTDNKAWTVAKSYAARKN